MEILRSTLRGPFHRGFFPSVFCMCHIHQKLYWCALFSILIVFCIHLSFVFVGAHCLCDKNEWPLINFWTECWSWCRRLCLVDTEYCFNFWCWFRAQKNVERNANEYEKGEKEQGCIKNSHANQIKSMHFKMNRTIVLMSFLTQIHRHRHTHPHRNDSARNLFVCIQCMSDFFKQSVAWIQQMDGFHLQPLIHSLTLILSTLKWFICVPLNMTGENGFVFNNGIFNWATCPTSPIDTKHVY